MAETIEGFGKALSSFLELKQVNIDNWWFKLFYKVTTVLLLLSTALVTVRQFFGDPIQCDAGSMSDGIEREVLNSYCWMYSTWNLPPSYKGACSAGVEDRTSVVYNSYYQWVPLYLLLLAILFYLPRMIWLVMEGGLVEFFGQGTMSRIIDDREKKMETLVRFFSENIFNKYNIYYLSFIIIESLNWLFVLLQFGLSNVFLHHHFSTYGLEVLTYYRLPEEEQKMTKNPMCQTFPRMASCDYPRYGPGGGPENINALCVLSLNMINDKVFLVLWWWFLLLAIVGGLRIVYRIVQTQSSAVRFQLINLRMNSYFKTSHKSIKIENYIYNCSLGDWFVLYQLSKNLDKLFFMDFLALLSTKHEAGDEESDGEKLLGQSKSALSLSEAMTIVRMESEDKKL